MEPGLHSTWPRSTSSFFVPRSRAPTLSPARPSSNSLRNISMPVTVVFWVSRSPTISTSSPTLTMPCSTFPVTTVPRPVIDIALALGDVGVHRRHQLGDLLAPLGVALQRLEGADPDDRRVVTREFVLV